jgi:hypothetical protein
MKGLAKINVDAVGGKGKRARLGARLAKRHLESLVCSQAWGTISLDKKENTTVPSVLTEKALAIVGGNATTTAETHSKWPGHREFD